MYLCDTHIHTRISHDSQAPLAAMVKSAREQGLAELCVTDHCDLLDSHGNFTAFFDWAAAAEEYRAVKAENGGLPVLRLGIELGSATRDPEAARRILAQGGEDLDFVLGSFHNWMGEEGDSDLFYYSFTRMADCRRAMENCLKNTWELVTGCPDCYDSLAHIVYPMRYMERDGQKLPLEDYEEQIRAIFAQLAATDHALEVNTCRGRTLTPWPMLLSWFRQCGGKLVTLGSDAHRPDHVGRGLSQAAAMVKAAGFDHITTYHRRKPELHRL